MKFNMLRNAIRLTSIGLTFALSIHFSMPVMAQKITESLQKQIWPGATTWSSADWEALLPAADHDLIVDADVATAERIERDPQGLPTCVTTLQLQDGIWLPISKTVARFDAQGKLTMLQSWIWENGIWENESRTEHIEVLATGSIDFVVQFWNEAHWETSYRSASPTANAAISGNMQP
jgi:hypothetical protein